MNAKKPYYPILESEMVKKGIQKQSLAKELNITPRSFSQKLSGKVDFWWREVEIIKSTFPDIPVEQLLSQPD